MGSDINLVDVATIRRIVHDRFFSDTTAAPPAVPSTTQPAPALTEPVVLDVINATSHDGLAAAIEDEFASRGFTRGSATTAANPVDDSIIEYGRGASEGAQMLADRLHVPATTQDTVSPGTIRLTVGTRFPAGDVPHPPRYHTLMDRPPDRSMRWPPPAPVLALRRRLTFSQMTATSIPCVK